MPHGTAPPAPSPASPPELPPQAAAAPKRARSAGAQARAKTLEHELHVHQVELEMQNEELRRSEAALASARDRFVDLYDFAPVGYFTLDGDGVVVEANLTGAALLGEDRKALLKRRFSRFVAAPDADRWHQLQLAALQQGGAHRIEVSIQPRGGVPLHGQLDCVRVEPQAAQPLVRIALTDITQRKQAELERRIAAASVEAREAERRRVARELHEELGQRLSALKMDLAGLHPTAGPPAARLGAMLETLDEAMAMVRRIAAELRPLMLDDLGLTAAVEWLAHDAARRMGLAITLRLDDADPALREGGAIAVYRLLQDVLGYIGRHARATELRITMQKRPDELLLSVQYGGTGSAEPPDAGVAADEAASLQQQARLLGGRLVLVAAAGGGARFTLHIPLPDAQATPGRPNPQGFQ